jgi:Family of unknown function (DUF6151)
MVVKHPLQCRCGTIQGFVTDTKAANHVVCYCKDCQAFAHFLGHDRDILDARGGSEVVQTAPQNIRFNQGIESIACMRLTDKGLLRWYADCCKTPIGNTLATPKISFVGLLHSCLQNTSSTIEQSFGPVRVWAHTQGAKGQPKPKGAGVPRTVVWFLRTTLKARLTGGYKNTPFFNILRAAPIVQPRVLSEAERARIMASVDATPLVS